MKTWAAVYFKTFLIIILVLTGFGCSALLPPGGNKAEAADEYDNLRLKWRETLNGGNSYDPTDLDIINRISQIDAEAYEYWTTMITSSNRAELWSDLQSNSIPEDIQRSYDRLKVMALAYTTKGSSYQANASLKNYIINGLNWLYNNRYNENVSKYGNWWHWEIGIPLSLNDCTILMHDDLTNAQIGNYMNAINKFTPSVTMNAANRVWKATVVGLRGVIVKDSAKIAAAKDGLNRVFKYVSSGDGFYRDGSFIQHKNHPYNGGYGMSLIENLANLMYLLNGSSWEITSSNKYNVFRWIYDSFEPLIYKGAMMDMVRGREISRHFNQDHIAGHKAIYAIARLSQFALRADAEAFRGMVKRWIKEDTYHNFYSHASVNMIVLGKNIVNNATSRVELLKHYQFPNMDRVVHRGPGYAFGISMHSNRIENYESINSENLRGWHTGDGMTYLYNNDLSQYSDNFWPTVDAYRLPGTTVLKKTSQIANKASDRNWVGGVTLKNIYGITGMQLHPYSKSLKANKSWFMFDNEIVALGSDISATNGKAVETIIENRKINNNGDNYLTINGKIQPTSLGWKKIMNNVNWIHLQGNIAGSAIGYYFPTPSRVKGLRESRTGSWKDINKRPVIPETLYTRNYLTLWFDHGIDPSRANYSYVLLPNKTRRKTNDYASNPEVTILEGSEDAHAVRETKLDITGVNFWKDQPKTVGGITSDKKASIMMQKTTNELIISVSDPTHANKDNINIKIDKIANCTLSKHARISVNQLNPTIQFSVNVNGSQGASFEAKFSLDEGRC